MLARAYDEPTRGPDSVLLFEAFPPLTGVPDVLDGLTELELKRVTKAGIAIPFAPGDVLFQQGAPHEGIFIIRHGIVRSFYVAPNGREITLAHWTPGNFVGGPEIFGGGVHMWSGTAETDGHAIRLPGEAVIALMREIPRFSIGLVQGLAFKGKCYSTLLQMLGTRSVVERLAQVLLNLADLRGIERDGRITIEPALSHEALAGLVGATRQWVSISLDRFRKRGLIAVDRRQLVILQRATLEVVANGS